LAHNRIVAIWKECLATYGGPYLFGKQPCIADAMYAPVVTRFLTYDVALDKVCAAYCKRIMELPAMQEWVKEAKKEPDDFKPFWPPALVQQAPPAIILAALRRFRGPALFRGLRPSSRLGAPFGLRV
jgi:hypothetical protein